MRRMAMNTYAHKNGSQSGMMPSSDRRSKVSTPVEIKRYSEKKSVTNPNMRNMRSFLSWCIASAAKIKTFFCQDSVVIQL